MKRFFVGLLALCVFSIALPVWAASGVVSQGLPGEIAARIAADNALQNKIDTIQLIPGPQGPPGPSITGVTRLKSTIKMDFMPAIGTSLAYIRTYNETDYYDTTGKILGWFETSQNGNTIVSTSVTNYTAYDDHNTATAGYTIQSLSPVPTYLTQSTTYDSEGRRTQRVRNYYDSNNNVIRIQTTNYDVDHHGAYVSVISVVGPTTTTVTYYNNYDSNGYPTTGTTTTSQYNSLTGTTINWTGTAIFEYVFIPDVQYPTRMSAGY